MTFWSVSLWLFSSFTWKTAVEKGITPNSRRNGKEEKYSYLERKREKWEGYRPWTSLHHKKCSFLRLKGSNLLKFEPLQGGDLVCSSYQPAPKIKPIHSSHQLVANEEKQTHKLIITLTMVQSSMLSLSMQTLQLQEQQQEEEISNIKDWLSCWNLDKLNTYVGPFILSGRVSKSGSKYGQQTFFMLQNYCLFSFVHRREKKGKQRERERERDERWEEREM